MREQEGAMEDGAGGAGGVSRVASAATGCGNGRGDGLGREGQDFQRLRNSVTDCDVHVAHVLELLVLLGEEELAGGVEDGERGDAFGMGTWYLSAMSTLWSIWPMSTWTRMKCLARRSALGCWWR